MKKTIVTLLVIIAGIAVYAQQAISKAQMDRGKQVYDTNCMACHQPDGGGVPRLNPPLIKTSFVLGDKSKLIGIVLNGLNESVEIDGEEYNNPMPGFPHLTDQQVADVLTYIRNSFGNKASAVTLAQVKAERAKLR